MLKYMEVGDASCHQMSIGILSAFKYQITHVALKMKTFGVF